MGVGWRRESYFNGNGELDIWIFVLLVEVFLLNLKGVFWGIDNVFVC